MSTPQPKPPLPPPPGESVSISQRLVYALDLREMSQHGLEQAAHLSRGYVSRMRRGERMKFSPGLLRRVADALHVSYEWLATGRGPLEPTEPPPAPAPSANHGVPPPGVTALLPGFGPPPPPNESALETAIAYHRNKWNAPTKAAARAFAADEQTKDLLPEEWAGVLDQIEAALAKIKVAGKPRA
jgi:transcriptional regulator with XRE-family HTH domain